MLLTMTGRVMTRTSGSRKREKAGRKLFVFSSEDGQPVAGMMGAPVSMRWRVMVNEIVLSCVVFCHGIGSGGRCGWVIIVMFVHDGC